MDELADARARHHRLDSLSISGFRGISQLTISRLERVALIAGKNGVGKTTVLDALCVYAAHGQLDTLRKILTLREEETTKAPVFDSLFHRNGSDRATIEIGPIGGGPTLQIEEVDEHSVAPEELRDYIEEGVKVLSVAFDGARSLYPRSLSDFGRRELLHAVRLQDQERSADPIRCESVGPGLLGRVELARLWDEVALTDDEVLAIEALRLVFGDRVDRAAVIGEKGRSGGRRVVVKLAGHANPVPLRSLGDGATRMFGVALALANCRDGILLIDEAENGIHYSLQSKFWNMVLHAADAHNVQVLATTHSKDCINGFAAAALDCPDVNGNLIRLERRNGEIRAVEYSREELETAAEQNIEVR